jgi:nitrogen-specific signal transduction histidine kinase
MFMRDKTGWLIIVAFCVTGFLLTLSMAQNYVRRQTEFALEGDVSHRPKNVQLLNPLADRHLAKNFLNELPTAVGVWYVEPFFCVFNQCAVRLTGFSEADFEHDESLWLSRVHPRDRGLISAAWKKVRTDENEVTCEYRFLPNRCREEIWLRDVSLRSLNPNGKIAAIISVYTDISSLLANKTEGTQVGANLRKVIEGLAHEVRNYVQSIYGAVEFLQLTKSLPTQSVGITNGIEGINRLLAELEEYFFPPNTQLSVVNPVSLLQDVLVRMQDELLYREIHLEVVHDSSLPHVQLDTRQIRQAVERLLEFAVAMLPGGGKLTVTARRREIDGAQYVELQIISYSASLKIDETEVFQPFLQVQKYKAGLSLPLVRETLYRNRGQISFRKNSQQEALFSVLLEAYPGE